MISSCDKLILLCSRTDLDHERGQQVREILETKLGWQGLIARSLQLGVAPLLYHNLKKIGPPLVPEDALLELRDAHHHNWSRNMLLSIELLRIIRLFEKNGIVSIPLKGVVLAEDVYRQIGLRMMVDLDLLVRQRDLIPATRLLVQNGFELIGPWPEDYDINQLLPYDLGFQKSDCDSPWFLELHRSFGDYYYRIPETVIWENRVERALNGETVQALSPELTLVYLVLHLEHHNYTFKVLVDVSEAVRAYGERLDWDKVARLVRDHGLAVSYKVAIKSIQRLFGRSVPEELSDGDQNESLKERWLSSLVANEDWYFGRREKLLQSNPYASRLLGALFLDWSLLRIFKTLLQSTFFPAVDSVAATHHLPRGSGKVYWLLAWRPLRLTYKVLTEIVKALFALCTSKRASDQA